VELLTDYQQVIIRAIRRLAVLHFSFGDEDEHGNVRNQRDFVFSDNYVLQDRLVRDYLVTIGIIADMGRLDRNFKDQALLQYVKSGQIQTPTYVWNRHAYVLDAAKVDIMSRRINFHELPPIRPHRSYTNQMELTYGAEDTEPDFHLDE